ncbi:unnamed protein product [Polarella glacialis]|uniref:Transmembrane protein n=1 Tax=Polarella glacialis TaxID=89957 RepID=A0A813DKH0_POLGL|nr:unnamed protein product [Polarella glacialis]CAE8718903.1 unnamed protein product [Polarella glacialis]
MEQDPMISNSEAQTEESSACEVICRVLYGIFAQGLWLLLGAVVGFFAPFAGVSGGAEVFGAPGGGASAGYLYLPLLTIPACALVSAGVAFACLVSGQSAANRIKICAVVNCCLFLLLASWTFFETYKDRPGQGLSNNNYSNNNNDNSNISKNSIPALPSFFNDSMPA